jgi:hypothetical protein
MILVAGLTEYALRKIPNNYQKKADKYLKDADKFEVLILGTSYGIYSLNPAYFDSYGYNSSHILQSHDLDLKLYNKYEGKLKKLKCVIVPVTFASFFFKLESIRQNVLIQNYGVYYGLHTTNKIQDYFEVLKLPYSVNRARLFDHYLKKKNYITVTETGFDSTYRFDNNRTIGGFTAGMAKFELNIFDHSLYNEQRANLEKLVDKCNKKNINVILFTPPADSSFYTASDTADLNTSIRTCLEIQKYPNVKYYNFYGDTSFHKSDFYDFSHLNAEGAKKLSLRINNIVNHLTEKQ